MRILLIILINLLVYFITLKFDLCSDDVDVFNQSVNKAEPNRFKRLWLKYKNARIDSPQEAHLFTLLNHTLVCICIYLGLGCNYISFIASLFFAVNPINNQASIFISGRNYSTTALLVMLGFTFPIISPIFMLLANRFMISGLFSSLCFLGTNYWYMSLFFPIIAFFSYKRVRNAINEKIKVESTDLTVNLRQLVIAIKTYGYYFKLCLIPYRIAFYHEFMQSLNGSWRKRWEKIDFHFWLGLSLLITTIYCIIFVRHPLTWGLFFYSINIAMFTNFIKVSQEISDRYAYLPNIGVMYFLSSIVYPSLILTAIIFTYYVTRLFSTMSMYKNDYWLTEMNPQRDTRAWIAWHRRGIHRFLRGSLKEAFNNFQAANVISPNEFITHFNMAQCLRIMKRFDDSRKEIGLARQNIVDSQREQAEKMLSEFNSGKIFVI